MKIIQQIYEFNKQAGLLDKPMDSFKETAYVIEEALEGFEKVFINKDTGETPKARQIALEFVESIKEKMEEDKLDMPSEVEELDKAIDIVVFSIGKIAKMGLSPAQISYCFKVVSDANMAKLSAPKDENGKQMKPIGWEGPEEELQKVLNSRG